MPTFEHFTLREITVARVERFLKTQAAKSHSKAKHSKGTLNMVMRYAMRCGAIPRNPVDATTRLRASANEPKALTPAELEAIRRAAREWRTGASLPGPKPDGQVRDLIEVMLGTSTRIGEALALRKGDVDVTTSPAIVRIAGTIVVPRGKGVHRQPFPKTHKSKRTVAVPQFAAEVIRHRLSAIPDADAEHLLFFTKGGKPLTPYNARRTFRQILQLAGLEGRGVKPHSLRKTAATLLAKEAGDKTAADMLGHADTRTTRRHYIEREDQPNPLTAEILEKLAPGHPKPAGK
jgi:integrase